MKTTGEHETKMKIDAEDPRLTGYVVGALSPSERQGLAQELDACPASRAQVEELSATAALLGQALAAEPMTSLTAAQRAVVAAELGRQAAAPIAAASDAAASPEETPEMMAVSTPRRGWSRGRAERRGRARIFSAVAAAAAVVLLLGGVAFFIHRDGEERSRSVAGGNPQPQARGSDDRQESPLMIPVQHLGGGPGAPRRQAPASQRVGGPSSPRSLSAPARRDKVAARKATNRLTPDQFIAVLRTSTPALKACANMVEGQKLLEVQVTVQPTGEASVQVLSATEQTKLGRCLQRVLTWLRYPRFTGAARSFVIPLTLVAHDSTRASPLAPRQPPPSIPAGQVRRVKALLAKAQNAYIAGNHQRAVQLSRQVLKLAPKHAKSIHLLGASSCYLRRAKQAQWAHDRSRPRYREALKKVCQINGVFLK